MESVFIGVDIGGTKVRVVFASRTKFSLKLIQPTVKIGVDSSLVNQVTSMIIQGLKELQMGKENIEGIGISSAGPFIDGIKIFSPNISGSINGNDWGPVPFIETLKNEFGSKIPIELANDCVSSVKAEQLFGGGRGYQNLVYVTISTGVGAGIIIDDHLCQGKGRNSGHFGHMILLKDGPQCGCGNHGCAESLLSGTAIARQAYEMGLVKMNGEKLSTKEIFDSYRDKNQIAIELITKIIEYLGVFFSNIINITDCRLIVIGGSVFYHNHDILLDPVKKYLKSHSYSAICDGVEFKLVGLGEYVGDVAGLSLVIPLDLVKEWQTSKLWENGYEKEYQL